VLARNSVLNRFQYAPIPGSAPARLRGLLVLGLALALGTGRPPEARGSGIFRDLTAEDRSQPILLAASGEEISLSSSGHAASALSTGKIPAYLAFPLDGGEHIPAHTPTIATGTQQGEDAVGPLDLTPSVQGPLNADLLASRGAIVNTPDGSYAVAILPRYARALAQATSSSSSSSSGGSATSVLESMLGLSPKANWTILGISTNELSQWYKDGTKELSHLTSLGASGVSKTLGVKVTPTSSGLNVAAQILTPPTSANPAAGSASVATPEPGAWLVFGLILGAAALKRRAG
jgi:hypothetical protein